MSHVPGTMTATGTRTRANAGRRPKTFIRETTSYYVSDPLCGEPTALIRPQGGPLGRPHAPAQLLPREGGRPATPWPIQSYDRAIRDPPGAFAQRRRKPSPAPRPSETTQRLIALQDGSFSRVSEARARDELVHRRGLGIDSVRDLSPHPSAALSRPSRRVMVAKPSVGPSCQGRLSSGRRGSAVR
jgi:hypothetical protein